MNVTETPLKGDIVPLPKSAQKKYPTTIKMLPQNFHVSAFCGARSSGKSWKCCQLLYLYQLHGYTDPTNGDKCCQRIILISPTYLANEHLFKPLKHLAPDDIHQTYSEQLLQDIIANIKEEADATEKYLEEKAMLKKISKVRRIEDLTEEMLEFLEWYDGNLPEPKYKTRCVTHLVLDDLAGSGCYTNKSKSALTNRVILNPVISKRSVLEIKETPERWNKIILEAAQQSGRIYIPVVHSPLSLEQALSGAKGKVLAAVESSATNINSAGENKNVAERVSGLILLKFHRPPAED